MFLAAKTLLLMSEMINLNSFLSWVIIVLQPCDHCPSAEGQWSLSWETS